MKIPTQYRVDVRFLEIMHYLEGKTRIDKTKRLEKILLKEFTIAAMNDPEIKRILEKTPLQVERDQRTGRGFWKYRNNARKLRQSGRGA